MASPAPARAETPAESDLPVAFGADQVRVDPKAQALDAIGHVHVDEPPFHLTSDELRLWRVPIGVALDGGGKVAFCPCFGSPLAVRFRAATIAPPHDLVLRDPVLEVFGVPLAWAPVMWLRSAGRVGILAPDIQWRGADGLFLGEGVHIPWRGGDLIRGLDLRAGGYVDGGAAVRGTLRTAISETYAGWDFLRGDAGVTIAAHGATAIADGGRPEGLAWGSRRFGARARSGRRRTSARRPSRTTRRGERPPGARTDGRSRPASARSRRGEAASSTLGPPALSSRRGATEPWATSAPTTSPSREEPSMEPASAPPPSRAARAAAP